MTYELSYILYMICAGNPRALICVWDFYPQLVSEIENSGYFSSILLFGMKL